jgi:hypothetical protein
VSDKITDVIAAGEKLKNALVIFMNNFEHVFEGDWEHSAHCLGIDDDNDQARCFIESGRSFLNPGVKDESSNWCARGALLHSYRQLKALALSMGLDWDYIEAGQAMKMLKQSDEFTLTTRQCSYCKKTGKVYEGPAEMSGGRDYYCLSCGVGWREPSY